MVLGTAVRQKRKALRLTQDVVARRAGISKPYLSNIETGRAKNPPTNKVLADLESALGFDSGQLRHLADLLRTPQSVLREREMLEELLSQVRTTVAQLVSDPQIEAAGSNIASTLQQLNDSLSRPRSPEGGASPLAAGARVPIVNSVSAGYPHRFVDLNCPPHERDQYVHCPELHDPQAFAARVVGDSMEPNYRQGDIVVISPQTSPRSGDDCFVRFDGDYSTTFQRFYQEDEQTVRLQPINSRYAAQTFQRARITGLWPVVWRLERIRK